MKAKSILVRWQCDMCLTAGTLRLAAYCDLWSGVQDVADDHRNTSPTCDYPASKLRVRLMRQNQKKKRSSGMTRTPRKVQR